MIVATKKDIMKESSRPRQGPDKNLCQLMQCSSYTVIFSKRRKIYSCSDLISPYVNWGSGPCPGGTAIPGQPVTRQERAPDQCPLTKVSLISLGPVVPISDIKLIRTDTTL